MTSVVKLQLISAGREFQYIYTVYVIILGLVQFPFPYLTPFAEPDVKKIFKLLTPWGTVNINLFLVFII